MKTSNYFIILILVMFISAATVSAGEVVSTFSPGDSLTAAKMTEIKDAVNDNDSRVTANETAISNNAADIATNASDIADNSSRITNAETAIGNNTADISTNSSNTTINANAIANNASEISAISTTVNDLPAAAGMSYINNNDGANCHTLTNSVTTTASTQLVAPADGLVFVTFSAYTYIVHTLGTYDRMRVGLSNTSGTTIYEGLRLQSVSSGLPTDSYYHSVSTQQAYPVTAGSTNTFYVNSQKQFGTGDHKLCHYNLTAIFVPTDLAP